MATGIVIALVCFIGLTALLLAVVPLVAILPILLNIGLVIGTRTRACQATSAQCATRSPNDHSEHRSMGPTQVDSALAAPRTSPAQVGLQQFMGSGVA
jgi:AGZA family xanthine/uracil permease-like MFS transporter